METTSLTKEQVIDFLKEKYTDEKIQSEIDERMPDYLDDDWRDDFEDEYSAYQEQGRGETESSIVNEIGEEIFSYFKITDLQYENTIGESVYQTIRSVFEVLDVD